MRKQFRIRSIVVCDDVRREDNGKEILIGVYNGIIIVPRFPSILRQLLIRIEYEWHGNPTHKFRAVITKNKTKILEADGETTLSNPADPASISMSVAPIGFDEAAMFSIKFGIDGPPRQVGWFAVREAAQPPDRDAEGG